MADLFSKASPRPWHIGTKRKYAAYGVTSEQPAVMVQHEESTLQASDGQADANLALTVEAVNAYERLSRIEETARWYLRCRDMVGEGKVVRGLDEAEEALRHALEVDEDARGEGELMGPRSAH